MTFSESVAADAGMSEVTKNAAIEVRDVVLRS